MFTWEERNLEEKCTNRLPDQLWKHTVKENNVLVQRWRIWWNHCSPNSKYISLSASLRFLGHRYLIFYVGHSEDRIPKTMSYDGKRKAKQKKKICRESFGSFTHILALFDTKRYWHPLENIATINFTSTWRKRKIIEFKDVCFSLKYFFVEEKKNKKPKQPCKI